AAQDGTNARAMVLDTATAKLAATAKHTTAEMTYTVYPIDSSLTAPQGFEDAALVFDATQVRAWRDLSREGFYLLYVKNADGQFGYYTYDELEGTFQRFVQSEDVILPTPTPTPSPSPTPIPTPQTEVEIQEDINAKLWRTIAICAIVGCILALGALSVTIFIQHHPRRLMENSPEAFPEETFADEALLDEVLMEDPFEGTETYTDAFDEQEN
ncbi:MAG: hypothetical protein J6L88_07505, partial [Clostridia bacterium]|nr:hypothetical protein [Clostridia bacterium]